MADARGRGARYWRENLRILSILLAIWFAVSFVCGILLVEPLNAFRLAGFPLGFWFAQQGAIYVFVALILVYAVWMDRVDSRYRQQSGGPRSADGGSDRP